MALLLTGATGHLGPHLVAGLLREGTFDRLYVVARDFGAPAAARVQLVERIARQRLLTDGSGRTARVVPIYEHQIPQIGGDVQVIVHAAADTRFAAPLEVLRAVNVETTRRMCRAAECCRQLRQMLFVSTTCVAGRRAGHIREEAFDDAPGFANHYERTKWEAERVVASSGIPARIARLSTCAGSHATGYVHRFGAVHHLLRWMSRGLIPMVPGRDDTPVDVISTDVAAGWLARAAARDPNGVEICHVALGERFIPLGALLEALVPLLDDGRRRLRKPAIVSEPVFRRFSDMVRSSGDVLMSTVQESTAAMLPTLLYPRTFDVAAAERCWGGELRHPDWRSLLARVVAFARERASDNAKEACDA